MGDITYARQVLAHSNWVGAMSWAESLVVGQFDDWRLPDPPEALGIFQNGPVISGSDRFFAISQYFEPDLHNVIWTSHLIPGFSSLAVVASIGTGYTSISFVEPLSRTGAVAVHNGSLGVDLNAATVPLPGTLALIGLGMIGLAMARKVSR